MKNFLNSALCVFLSILFVVFTVTDTVISADAATYTVAKSYSIPKKDSFQAGSKLKVSVTARTKAKVTATLDGKKITLTPATTKGNGFTKFSGSFTLPDKHIKDKNLGPIKFKATYKKHSKNFKSKDIICKKPSFIKSSNKKVTPESKDYINVGSGIITKVVMSQAETFSGSGSKDTSKPYYNYLPKGTIDYGSSDYVTIKRDGNKYKLITLRCGQKVYKATYDTPTSEKLTVTKQYAGTLPDHNELSIISFDNGTSHTILKLGTLWKAPFKFKLGKQKYNNDYSVDKVTYTYVDITFCYATKLDGKIKIPKDNHLFKKAKIIKNKDDYTLRLYLKKKGAFYGWNSYYDSKGNLCFEFLNPAKITKSKNKYGANLKGVKILIDVGHGGKDSGAVGFRNKKKTEAERNLTLAKKIKKELKSIGATVYMTRKSDKTSTTYDKMAMLSDLKPDYCIAIHHDHNISPRPNGFGAYYYYPFSKKAAKYVLDRTEDTKIYKKETLKWHYYYMSRVSICPVVLTENGFMSNYSDFSNIKKSKVNTKKAVAITKGIVDYFKSIQ
ncbi:MAG: N-acetylmuramoyl-L-alanine amidase [Clostridia bacterium]|nr:N-acetylmuramoyl-L-alanine amidase [Clostridia bacterium]